MKKAIVIGATSGIGKGIAQLLTDNGYRVGITGRRTELLEELKSEKHDRYVPQSLDVIDTKSTLVKLEELTLELGGLDLLIISAGTGDLNDSLDFEIEKRTIETNVMGFTAIATWAFTFFQKQKYGHLVAISSIAGLRGSRSAPSYNATKAYQIKYLEALRQKANHLKCPIQITDVRPGFVDTDMAKGEGQFWVAPVDKACQQIFNAILARRKIVYVTKRWHILAALLKQIPRQLYDRM